MYSFLFNLKKIHNRFCKPLLCVKKPAGNIAAKSELGRLPLSSFIKIQSLLYFTRINLTDINPLVKEALEVNKSLHSKGVYTWYTFILNISKFNRI